MDRRKNENPFIGDLRRRAEDRVREDLISGLMNESWSILELQQMIPELKTRRLELEQQNAELQRSRVEAEEALARYTDLYEQAPVGYLTLDRFGVILGVNLTGANLLGLNRSHLVGRHLRDLVAPESVSTFDNFLAGLFEKGSRDSCEIRLHRGEEATWAVEFIGEVATGMLECRVVLTEITERLRAELDRVAMQVQLVQAQKDETIGTLAGGIAHDFNNILAGLLGGLSLLDLDLGEEGKHHQDIQEMKELVRRGADLTRQILGFASRGRYDVKPLDLGDAVRTASTIFGRTRRDVSIMLDFATDLRAVLMDRAQLEQILLNILVNAGQAMPKGGHLSVHGRNVKVDATEAEQQGVEPGWFVKLAIRDSGIGMDATTQSRVFEPFFTTRSPGEGSGLGLASVYGILRGHGGCITVDSILGQGTVFTLFLPTTEMPADREPLPSESIESGSGTILVVDDERMIVDVCTRQLKILGYDAVGVISGLEAVELVRQRNGEILLVILDMVMPGMNGTETFDALRQVAPDMKVLLSSGYSVEGQAREILARGGNGFIQKPYDMAALSAKLREILCR
jgi:PAS domain S-box-containing protein